MYADLPVILFFRLQQFGTDRGAAIMIPATTEQHGLNCTINTTEDCNLRCKYCYEINKRSRTISLDTCRKFIDVLLEDDDPAGFGADSPRYEEGLVLDFIGGDSLVDPDLLDKICTYLVFRLNTAGTRNARRWRDKYRFSLSTNGTLFSRPNVRAFCEKWREVFSVGVSVDGCPEIHDLNRVFPDGSPSMPEILKSWDWYRAVFPDNALSTKATCARASIPYLAGSLQFMHEQLGLRYINQNFIMEDDGYTEEDYAELERQMDLCVAYVLEHRDDLYWSMLDRRQFADHHLSTGKDWTEEGHCGSGGMPALSIDGNIYPCFRWLPHTQSGKEDAFVCGSADRGMYNKDAFRRVREGAYRASCTKEEKCRTCEYESACPYCIGGCFAEYGEFRRTTHICRITKIQCAAAEKYWQAYDMQGGNGK